LFTFRVRSKVEVLSSCVPGPSPTSHNSHRTPLSPLEYRLFPLAIRRAHPCRKARKLANNEPEREDEPETEHERSSENPEE